MDEIKTTFPFNYKKQIDFYFIFELTPDDLFIKRVDKNLFSVGFNKNNPTNSFLLGSNFLKKYLFKKKIKSKWIRRWIFIWYFIKYKYKYSLIINISYGSTHSI